MPFDCVMHMVNFLSKQCGQHNKETIVVNSIEFIMTYMKSSGSLLLVLSALVIAVRIIFRSAALAGCVVAASDPAVSKTELQTNKKKLEVL